MMFHGTRIKCIKAIMENCYKNSKNGFFKVLVYMTDYFNVSSTYTIEKKKNEFLSKHSCIFLKKVVESKVM